MFLGYIPKNAIAILRALVAPARAAFSNNNSKNNDINNHDNNLNNYLII